MVNLSPSRLRVLFKAETGETIAQSARRVRMQSAEHLVANTFTRINEIADQLGSIFG
jgi:AraC-like DNA-binding protein